jgi:hypothetical protein
MITLTDNQFYTNRTWNVPLEYNIPISIQHPEWLELFDQDGYRLTKLESHYAGANNHAPVKHGHEICLRQEWFTGEKVLTGPHLNHAFLFERKGYSGEALEQLKEYAKQNNLVYKLTKYVGKWGLDFNVDYVDSLGNSIELLHYESDSFNLQEMQDTKGALEETILKVDWEAAARYLLIRKHEWIDLDFLEQSTYRTNYFQLPAERFRINAWE